MSYLKINKNSLSLIKDKLNNCYTSIENSVNNISNNLPTKRDLSILKKYKKTDVDYSKIGTEYNNSIDAINDNIVNSTLLYDLKSIINDIDSIIKAVDSFNNKNHTKSEERIANIYKQLSFLENIENTINNVEWETEEVKEEPTEEIKETEEVKEEETEEESETKVVEEEHTEELEEQHEESNETIEEINIQEEKINNEDLFAKIKKMSDEDDTKKIKVYQTKKEEPKEIEEEPKKLEKDNEELNIIDINKKEEEIQITPSSNNKSTSDIINNNINLIIIFIIGIFILIGLAVFEIINDKGLIMLSILLFILLLIYYFYKEKNNKEDKKE